MNERKDFFNAVERGDLARVSAALDQDPDLVHARDEDNEGNTPLHLAAMNGHYDIALLLLAKGAKVNARAELGRTPLHWAAWNGHLNIVRLLLANGADPNCKVSGEFSGPATGGHSQETGFTPLHYAAYEGHYEICQLLIERGAEVNARSTQGWTPLHRALFKGNREVAELLQRHGGME